MALGFQLKKHGVTGFATLELRVFDELLKPVQSHLRVIVGKVFGALLAVGLVATFPLVETAGGKIYPLEWSLAGLGVAGVVAGVVWIVQHHT